jgi:D-threo-aldose 1-dehydrogenase
MRTVDVPGTGLVTSQLGFGCAGAFRLGDPRLRRNLLDAAYDAGFRHFDVAPMYGMGRAEAELAPLLARHRDDVTVTTKFGISVTAVGRASGVVQRPVRALLARRPDLGREVRQAGSGPRSGPVGRLLYRSTDYSAAAARDALDASLRALGTDHVDLFALHDPMGGVITGAPELVAHLEDEVDRGRIRSWGVAGDIDGSTGALRELLARTPYLQFADDLLDPGDRLDTAGDRATMTFGAYGRALPALQSFFAGPGGDPAGWSDRLGWDVTLPHRLAAGLLRQAVRRNRGRTVLVTTTQTGRLAQAAAAVDDPHPDEHDVMVALAAAVRAARPDPGSPGD